MTQNARFDNEFRLPHTANTDTGTQAAWAPGSAHTIRANPGSNLTVQGMANSGNSGMTRLVINVSSNTITFKHQDAAATAVQRIITVSAGDVVLSQGESALFTYDSTDQRWRLLQKFTG